MKRKIDWDEEEESGQEDSTISDDESDSEELLNNLCQAVSRKYASELFAWHGHFQRYLVLDTSRRITSKATCYTSKKHLKAA